MMTPLIAAGSVGLAAAAVSIGYANYAPSCQWFGPVLWRGDPAGAKQIALTFDDGPTPGATDRIMECLDRFGVKAGFFCIGANAQAAPDLMRAMDASGHLLANHSYDHARHGAFHGQTYWMDQLIRTNAAINDATGKTPKLFRPPMGIKTPLLLRAPIELGMHTVTWTHRGFDTLSRDPARIADRLTRRLMPGSVLVLHDGAEPGRQRDVGPVVDALPRLIESVQQAGYRFCGLDEVLGVPAYEDSACSGSPSIGSPS